MPYESYNLINEIYNLFEVIKREDAKDVILLDIFGDRNKIMQIKNKIKKWVCIIRKPYFLIRSSSSF